MAWYGWTIIGLLALLTIMLVILLIRKNKNQAQPVVDGQALADAERKSLTDQLAAEKKAKEAAVAAAQQLASEQKLIAAWYENQKSKIAEEARNEFQKLLDPDALDRKLDELLSPKLGVRRNDAKPD
jgi:hypothetical protein